MSLHYTLSIAGPAQVEALETRLQERPVLMPSAGGAAAPGFQIRLSTPGAIDMEIIEDEFGFTPMASVTFRMNKEADPVATRIELLRACVGLLEEGSSDAVLLFNGETVIFLRREGTFFLNPVEGFWTDEVLATMSVPHAFRAMPVL